MNYVKHSINSQKKVFTDQHRKNLSKSVTKAQSLEIREQISETIKGRSAKNLYWLITLVDDSKMKFKTRQEAADHFGVSKSLVNNWKYGRISRRWREHIIKVELKERKTNDQAL